MARGHDKERAVRRVLESDGWWTARAAGSLGDADIVASRPMVNEEDRSWRDDDGAFVRLIEVKANKLGGPFKNFGPKDRQGLLDAAALAGGEAVLAWWPPRGKLKMIYPNEWP